MRKLLIILIGLGIVSISAKAQYIIIDPDGYTNVRKEDNAKSEIVEVVKKHQVFYDEEDILCRDSDTVHVASDNWLPITTDLKYFTGYIYKPKVQMLNKLPASGITRLSGLDEDIEKEEVFSLEKDDVKFNITISPFDQRRCNDGKYVTEGRTYGTDDMCPNAEITKIELIIGGQKYDLPKSKFDCYFDPYRCKFFKGDDNAVYLMIEGGDGAGFYDVILSIVNGDIVYSIVSEC